MLTPGNVKEKHWAIGFGCIKLPSVSQVLCCRNGPWKWLDAVDVHQISCVSYCPWWIISVPRKTLDFKKVPTIMRVWPPPGTNHSTPLKAACPSYPPLLCTCQLMRSLTSFGFYSSNFCSKEYTLSDVGFSGLKEKDPLCLVFGSFQRKCLPSFCICLFVRSFFYLPYCSYKTYRWVDECIVLLLLTCLRLYGFAVSMFGGGKGTEGQKPWFKKEKD